MRAVSLGTSHACAMREDGSVHCWGDNSAGQTNAPTGVFVEIAVANTYSCGLRQDGALSCWGHNGFGEVGDGTTTARSTPTPVGG